VHLSLGGPDEVVINWASGSDEVQPEVVFWPTAAPRQTRTARGSSNSYSQLLYLASYLLDPPMGAPGTTPEALRALANTTSWALGDVASLGVPAHVASHGSGWKNGSAVPKFGALDYRNPKFYYTSPVLHTVTMGGLSPGQEYGYRVHGDTRDFSFTSPPNGRGTRPAAPHDTSPSQALRRALGQNAGQDATQALRQDTDGRAAAVAFEGRTPAAGAPGAGDIGGDNGVLDTTGGSTAALAAEAVEGASVYPYTFGLISDLGQTEVSAANVAAMSSALEVRDLSGLDRTPPPV